MVSVDPFSKSIYSVLEYLERVFSHDNKPGNLSGLLSIHFLLGQHNKVNINWLVSMPLDTWLLENASDLDQAPLLATLGCLLAENVGNPNDANTKIALSQFVDGAERLKQRQNIFASPNSWILNSEVVLGISIGVFTACANQNIADWLKGILEVGIERKELPTFLRLTYLYCLFLSAQTTKYKFEIREAHGSVTELAFDLWLARRFSDYLIYRELSKDWLEISQAKLLEDCLLSELSIVDSWKAAILWYVISDYVRARSKYPRLDLIYSMLSNFDAGMERWASKWKIENEYDVQAVLWLILRSVFSDLRYEESFPKLGRSGHRYDIGVPQLGLVVELKYTRSAKDFQKILDEVSKDAVQITTQSAFKEILVFVYDYSCSVEQYAWTKDAMESIDRVKVCIIKSAPSNARIEVKKEIASKKR